MLPRRPNVCTCTPPAKGRGPSLPPSPFLLKIIVLCTLAKPGRDFSRAATDGSKNTTNATPGTGGRPLRSPALPWSRSLTSGGGTGPGPGPAPRLHPSSRARGPHPHPGRGPALWRRKRPLPRGRAPGPPRLLWSPVRKSRKRG